jgi:hypothetical protein
MKKYSERDTEWQQNGYYIVDDIHYMSLYTCRELHGLPKVAPDINKEIGLNINPLDCDHIYTIPDIVSFDIIKAYELSYLSANAVSLFSQKIA